MECKTAFLYYQHVYPKTQYHPFNMISPKSCMPPNLWRLEFKSKLKEVNVIVSIQPILANSSGLTLSLGDIGNGKGQRSLS
jgi:hypothetical protein